ncbi:hypothetical protein [Photobacterium jeanii]|nr:hypothetical protein [Photobacterium jeanii]
MDTIHNTTFVAPTDDELLLEQVEQSCSSDITTELEDSVIILNTL